MAQGALTAAAVDSLALAGGWVRRPEISAAPHKNGTAHSSLMSATGEKSPKGAELRSCVPHKKWGGVAGNIAIPLKPTSFNGL